MPFWLWALSYFAIASAIVAWNDDFRVEALNDFSTKFKILVDELSMYIQPVGFPIELVARLCMGKLQT